MICIICHQSWLPQNDSISPSQGSTEEYSPAALSCGHIFHIDCILKWLCLKDCCPSCRKPQNSQRPTKLFVDNLPPQTELPSQNAQACDFPVGIEINPDENRSDLIKVLAEGYSEKLAEKNNLIESLQNDIEKRNKEKYSLTEKFITLNEKRLKLKQENASLQKNLASLNKLLDNTNSELGISKSKSLKLKEKTLDMESKLKTLDFYKQSLIESRKMTKSLSLKVKKLLKQNSKARVHSILLSPTSNQAKNVSQELGFYSKEPTALNLDHTPDTHNKTGDSASYLWNKGSNQSNHPYIPNGSRGALKLSVFKPLNSTKLPVNKKTEKSTHNPFALNLENISQVIDSNTTHPTSKPNVILGEGETNRRDIFYDLPILEKKQQPKRQTRLSWGAE
ncbi:hypothetical protein BB560_004080 [Smittium megazygosporum]|uniref:RING-type domain-containing protein n=1 Tax=Smittium megazygosporum TaxID=133381 RepID=A0A2T9ZAD8_9FUNG|nr:hypothetical protein BB560_004080 [Smittium megazygosporum]